MTYITTLREFIEWLEELNPGKYLFRGLSDSGHHIEASAWHRLNVGKNENDLEKFLEINKRLISDARTQEHGDKDGRKLSDLEILAELQHFRAATCLIDFTYSAQVALWFACQVKSDGTNLDGKVTAVLGNRDGINEITPELVEKEIDFYYFFETEASGRYPLYRWQPRQLNNRISPQYSVFLFGGERKVEPDAECIIIADSKQAILNSLEDFSQTTEATLFPDFDGFVRQRSQNRTYSVPNYKRSSDRAYQEGDYENAIAYCSQAINQNSNDIDIYKLRGDARVRLGRYESAIDDFDKVINGVPERANVYYARGDAKFSLHKLSRGTKQEHDLTQEAQNDFQRALKLISKDRDGDKNFKANIEAALSELNNYRSGDKQWTPDRFEKSVPDHLRQLYQSGNDDRNLYQFGADLQNMIEEQDWALTLRFGINYFVFYSGYRRVFGVNLSGVPRLAIWGVEEERFRLPNCDYEPTYYPSYKQWLYPPEAAVKHLSEVYEVIYNYPLKTE